MPLSVDYPVPATTVILTKKYKIKLLSTSSTSPLQNLSEAIQVTRLKSFGVKMKYVIILSRTLMIICFLCLRKNMPWSLLFMESMIRLVGRRSSLLIVKNNKDAIVLNSNIHVDIY